MRGIATPCILLLNNKWGYVMSPIECDSIKEAEAIAEGMEMAYRIYDLNGKKLRSGWR